MKKTIVVIPTYNENNNILKLYNTKTINLYIYNKINKKWDI